MDKFLTGSAVTLFVFGMLLLFKPNIMRKISSWLNKNVVALEDVMLSSNRMSGILLVILSMIILYLNTNL